MRAPLGACGNSYFGEGIDFIERILEGQFMTSQNDQTEPPEREQAAAGEILRMLPTLGDDDRTLQPRTNLCQECLFFFVP